MYEIRCVQCGNLFDAEAAPQCDCIEETRSVRCSFCHACFCKSDEKYKAAFWENAPPKMRERREELSQPLAAEKVRHPLVLFADDDPTSRAVGCTGRSSSSPTR